MLTLIQLGVVPEKGDKSKGSLVYDCLVARCLWESHWREEWCGVYEGTLSFYAPLTKKPSLELCKHKEEGTTLKSHRFAHFSLIFQLLRI